MNKKLIKILACSVCGLGITTSIPFMTTSCGSEDEIWPENVVPKNAYDIDKNGVLKGWVDGWGAERLIKDGYDTMIIPKNVTQIAEAAFHNASDKYNIPPIKLVLNSNLKTIGDIAFIRTPLTSIDFSKCSKLESIGMMPFNGSATDFSKESTLTEIDLSSCTNLKSIGLYGFEDYYSLNSIKLPSSLISIGNDAFGCLKEDKDSRNINIVWNDLDKEPTGLSPVAFRLEGDTGTVKSNSKNYSSKQLLEFLQQNARLPEEGWSAIE